MVPGLHRERAKGDAHTIRDCWRPNLNLSPLRSPGVSGSSPCTLTMSLATPVPSSSSSNGPSNYYVAVDNQGLVPWRLPRLGRSKVHTDSLLKVLSDDKIS